MGHAPASDSGFSLAEVLIAAAIVATAAGTLAALFGMGERTTANARDSGLAGILAAQKVEELKAVAWSVDEVGAPVGNPPASGTEYLDGSGNVVGTGLQPPDGATHFRWWRVEPLPANPAATLIFQVTAGRLRGGGIGRARTPGDASLTAAKTRKAS